VVRKTLGSKLIKMTYSGDAGHGRQVKVVDTTDAERNRFCITDEK
jgi:pyruvate,water dikinase